MNTRLTDIEELAAGSELSALSASLQNPALIPPLIYAEIHLTNTCNTRCYFCNQDSVRVGKAKIAYPEFCRLLYELQDLGLKGVRLSGGGEPSSYQNIQQVLGLLKSENIRLMRFDTNGILLTEELSIGLIDANIHTLHVSLIAPDAKVWAAATKNKEELYLRTVQNIRQFRSLTESTNIRTYISFIIDSKTYRLLPEMERLARDLNVGLDIHDLNNYVYSKEFVKYSLEDFDNILSLLSPETLQYRIHLSALQSVEELRKKKVLPFRQPLGQGSEQLVACLAPWSSPLICANGDVVACCALHPSQNILGNIYQSSFHDIWKGSNYLGLRNEASQLFLMRSPNTSTLKYLSRFCLTRCGPKLGMFHHHKVLPDTLKR